jgi:hypothetical protein
MPVSSKAIPITIAKRNVAYSEPMSPRSSA